MCAAWASSGRSTKPRTKRAGFSSAPHTTPTFNSQRTASGPSNPSVTAPRRYASRILVVYCRAKGGPDSDWGDTWWTFSQNVSLARCAFRLFRWIDEFNAAFDSLRSQKIGALWFFSSLRGLAIGTFIFMNNLYFFLNWKLFRFTSASQMKLWASYVRLVAESSGLLWMILKGSAAQRLLKRAEAADDDKAVAKAKETYWAAVFKSITFICNFSTYTDIAKVYPRLFGGPMSQVLFGILGTISAFAGMREPWKKSAVPALAPCLHQPLPRPSTEKALDYAGTATPPRTFKAGDHQ